MKIDLHTHSIYSKDGLDSPRLMIKYAKKKKLDMLAITDHNTLLGSIVAKKIDPEFIVSGYEISTKDGDIIALGVDEYIESYLSAEETIERIHEVGGIAVAVHPYALFRRGVGNLITKLPFDAVEVMNGCDILGLSNRRTKKVLSSVGMHNWVAGTDAHSADSVGYTYTVVEANNEDEVLHEIKRGKTCIGGRTVPFSRIISMLRRRYIGF